MRTLGRADPQVIRSESDDPVSAGSGRSVNAREPTTFCHEIWGPLVRSLELRVQSRETAEELAQDALAKVWNDWNRISAMDHPEAYTYRVAWNAANSFFRRKGAERRAQRKVGVASVETTPHLLSAESLDLRAAVSLLPRRQRDVIILRYFADMRVDDVAIVLGISPGTVKTSSHRAMTRLRTTLGDEHGTNP